MEPHLDLDIWKKILGRRMECTKEKTDTTIILPRLEMTRHSTAQHERHQTCILWQIIIASGFLLFLITSLVRSFARSSTEKSESS